MIHGLGMVNHGARKTSGSQQMTANGTFACQQYRQLTVQMWGGGGGGLSNSPTANAEDTQYYKTALWKDGSHVWQIYWGPSATYSPGGEGGPVWTNGVESPGNSLSYVTANTDLRSPGRGDISTPANTAQPAPQTYGQGGQGTTANGSGGGYVKFTVYRNAGTNNVFIPYTGYTVEVHANNAGGYGWVDAGATTKGANGYPGLFYATWW